MGGKKGSPWGGREQVHPARLIALVDETDVHIPTLTVEETLRFAYKCNSKQGKDQHVQTIMKVGPGGGGSFDLCPQLMPPNGLITSKSSEL